MAVVYGAAVAAAAVVLLWSGAAKIVAVYPLTRTLSELGMPPDLARAVAVVVPLCEIATVAFIVAGAASAIVAFFLAMLGISFAIAAGMTKLTGKAVRCSCFGISERKLGWPQLAALPLWLFSAWAALKIPQLDLNERLAIFLSMVLVLTALRARGTLAQAAGARSDRRGSMGG
jgi:hypothetical protein